MDALKTRFAPSPTGYLHVGGARTALFSYVMARKTGGTFVLRIEDTDRSRHDESAVEKILSDLRWLGLDWDEGVEKGGDNGPYRQSERLEVYREHVQKLLDSKKAYYAFDTAEELEVMRQTAQDAKQTFRYPRPDTFPTQAQADAAREAGKPVVVRLAISEKDVTVRDDAFGDVTMPASEMSDFIIQKADGYPTYHLANVVDDALMGVNYIMRGQEFLGQSWRHKLLREALGFDEPGYCHLPLIMDMEGRKLSKRDGAVEVHSFRAEGYLPETLLNFLSLLGWNPGEDREKFTLDELIELFSVKRIGKQNAKFDRDKLLAFNRDAIANADPQRLLEAFKDYLSLNETPIPADDDELLMKILEASQGMRTLSDAVNKCGVLFAADDSFEYQPKAVRKVLEKNEGQGFEVLAKIREDFTDVEWTPEAIESWMKDFCEKNELGMGKVAQPIRVAVTGSMVSPQILDTLMFLGREKTLARFDRCLQLKQ